MTDDKEKQIMDFQFRELTEDKQYISGDSGDAGRSACPETSRFRRNSWDGAGGSDWLQTSSADVAVGFNDVPVTLCEEGNKLVHRDDD